MGIQFTALDTRWIDPDGDGGRRIQMRVELPERWEFFGFGMGNAALVLGLLDESMAINGRPRAGIFTDHQYGEATLADARRAVMAARARFERVAPIMVQVGDEFQEWVDALGGRVTAGPRVDMEALRRRLEDFAEFVEAAATAGADRIMWS